MRNHLTALMTFGALVWLNGCSGVSSTDQTKNSAAQTVAEQGIAAVWQAYQTAGPAADVATFLAICTEDIALSSPGMPTVRGRVALKAFLEAGFKAAHYSEVSIFPETPAVNGDRATQFGTYRETYTTAPGLPAITDYGQFAAELRRGGDGKWRLARQLAAKDSSVTARR